MSILKRQQPNRARRCVQCRAGGACLSALGTQSSSLRDPPLSACVHGCAVKSPWLQRRQSDTMSTVVVSGTWPLLFLQPNLVL